MTCELELLMRGWTDEEKSSVYDKVERINSMKQTGNSNLLISDVINKLQEVLDLHGDLPVIYSGDDEGNHHHCVNWCGSVMLVEDIDSYYLETIDEEDKDDYNVEEYTKVVCIN